MSLIFDSDGSELRVRGEKKDQGVLQMALQQSVEQKTSTPHLLLLSGISGEMINYDAQFSRLKNFLHDPCTSHQGELELLLYPLFVHLYLDMLWNGHKTPAHKFYSRHSGQFIVSDFGEMVNELELLYSRDDILENKKVLEFRKHKYTMMLSSEALQYLLRYLKSSENILLLQVMNQYIDLQVQGCEEKHDLVQNEDRHLEGQEPVSEPCTPENKVIADELTLSALQSSMTRVRSGPPPLPSVCMYTFINAYQGLCCSSFSPNENALAGGFEDSSIRLWNLSANNNQSTVLPQSCDSRLHTDESLPNERKDSKRGAKESVNITQVHLSGDLPENVSLKNRQTFPSLDGAMVLKGHCGSVYSCDFTPDSTHLLSASEDSTVRLWDIRDGQCKTCYHGHNYPVWSVHSSHTGEYFVSGSKDHTARVWCTDRVYPIRTLIGHTADVDVVRFHPNGTYIATASVDRSIRLWTLQEGRAVRMFSGHKSNICCLAFSSNGLYLASAGEDRRVKLWDIGSGRVLKDLRGHSDIVYALNFNKDCSVLASGGLDATLRLWDIRREVAHTNTQETYSSPELLAAFTTKSTSVQQLRYSRKNYLMAVGSPT